ncbi:hypothetical protein A5747_13200 [Mycobacterium sp. IS-836]|uniref:histone-like nucleoid-structuring protein Lsr2 n=1 Tax=Mycobacterium sp. IS-836 TaxID=1834160 RepID=UPI00096C4AEC|nr:Lsr2 family protein [Mycobacterium sp. IS-836]OMC55346.1 hypothetical protein A5747_13200 [Mycobacterium sp. IS-836]
MATEVIHRLVDDLDGTAAEGTVDFSYKGTAYQIDLSTANDKKFDKAMEQWISKARKKGRAATRHRTRVRSPQAKADNDAIRAWAKKQGLQVSDRGKIPKDVVDKFETEHTDSEKEKLFSEAGAS